MGISLICTFGAQPMKAAQKLVIIKTLKTLLNLIALFSCFLFCIGAGLVALRHGGVVCLLTLFEAFDLRFKFGGPVSLDLPRVDHSEGAHDQDGAEDAP